MALAAPAHKRLVALHGWSATILSVLIYAVVLTGTIVVFGHEILNWSKGVTGAHLDELKVQQHYQRLAAQVPSELKRDVNIRLEGANTLRVVFEGRVRDPKTGKREEFARLYRVDAETGLITQAAGGHAHDLPFANAEDSFFRFIYQLHVRLHVPGRLGLYLTGIMALCLLVSLVTGILIHRHIITEMFVTGRPGGKIVSFRDRHNLAGVWSLPFVFVVSFTGAMLSFGTSLGLPVVALTAFGGDQQRAFEVLVNMPPYQEAAPAKLANLDNMMRHAAAREGAHVERITILNADRRNAVVQIAMSPPPGALRERIYRYHRGSGAFLGVMPSVGAEPSTGSVLVELIEPLHYGHFGGFWSKLAWAALGAAMCYAIVSGMQLWLGRRGKDPVWRWCRLGFELVVWGLPITLVASGWGYFLTRLSGDAQLWTTRGFLISFVLLVALVWHWRRLDPNLIGQRLMRLLGAGLLSLVLLRMLMGGLSWGEAILQANTDVLFIDLLCLIGAFICLKWLGAGGLAKRLSQTHTAG